MINRAFSLSIHMDFHVKLSVLNWLPHLGKFTRSSNLLVNTKPQKIQKGTGELEADCKELLEECVLKCMRKRKLIKMKK